jgi:hypothetical protein
MPRWHGEKKLLEIKGLSYFLPQDILITPLTSPPPPLNLYMLTLPHPPHRRYLAPPMGKHKMLRVYACIPAHLCMYRDRQTHTHLCGSTGLWTYGFVLARQVLYWFWTPPPVPLALVYFWDGDSLFAQVDLDHNPLIIHSHHWYNWHTPSCPVLVEMGSCELFASLTSNCNPSDLNCPCSYNYR